MKAYWRRTRPVYLGLAAGYLLCASAVDDAFSVKVLLLAAYMCFFVAAMSALRKQQEDRA